MSRVRACFGLASAMIVAGCFSFGNTPSNLTVIASADSTTVPAGRTIRLAAAADGGAAPYLYRWSLERYPLVIEDPQALLPMPTVQNTTTTAFSELGDYIFRIRITDSTGKGRSDFITITIRAAEPGEALVVNIEGPGNVEAEERAAFTATTTFAGDVTYHWEVVEGEAEIVSPDAAETEIVADATGTVKVRVTMTSADTGETATDEFDLLVSEAGAFTVAISGAESAVTNLSVTLTATTENAAGDPTFVWRIVTGPGILTSTSGSSIDFVSPTAGVTEIEVSATDAETDEQVTDTITITTIEGAPVEPFLVFVPSPQLVGPGESVTVDATTNPATPGTLSYEWEIVDGGGTVETPDGQSTSVQAGDSGTTHLLVTVTATNAGGSTRSETADVYIVVIDAPDPVIVFDFEGFGMMRIRLDSQNTPVTTANFLSYVDEGFFDGVVIHRIEKGDFGVVQGGGFTADAAPDYSSDELKPTHDPIGNESAMAGSNIRGTIAMARTNDPNSATSQFFLNTTDNSDTLDFGGPNPDGYAVFGTIIEGLDVLDRMTDEVETVDGGGISLLPVPVVMNSVRRE